MSSFNGPLLQSKAYAPLSAVIGAFLKKTGMSMPATFRLCSLPHLGGMPLLTVRV
jgi:hypothetical protein